jgi:hypothetical protein
MFVMKTVMKIDDEIFSYGHFNEKEYFSIENLQSYQSSRKSS